MPRQGTRAGDQPQTESGADQPQTAQPIGESMSSLGEDIARLVQQEVEEVTRSIRLELERMQAEATEHGRDAAAGAGYVGAAAGLGLMSAAALASIPLLMLRRVLPPTAIALLVAGGGAAGATTLGRRGLRLIEEALPESVEARVAQTRREVAETVRARVRDVVPG